MNDPESIAPLHERIDRGVRVNLLPSAVLYRATSRLLGGIGLPKAAEYLLDRATSKETEFGKKFTPHAEGFLKKIDGGISGGLFHLATIPFDQRETEMVAQLFSDYGAMVKENIHALKLGFAAFKDKVNTVLPDQSNPPPLKPA